MSNKRGSLIVIEGTDGAGKGTQLSLLETYCQNNALSYHTFDFPRYYDSFFGKVAGRFLKGDFGTISEVSPYLASMPYAADRWQAKQQIEQALSEGNIVFINRYVMSNAAYHAAKLPETEREAFITWNIQMEYTEFGVPKEDCVLFLHVPTHISQQLIAQKSKREYLGEDQKDIHESNGDFLQKVEKMYLQFANTYSHWKTISCVEEDHILSKETIHSQILDALTKEGILSSM
jgi:dTMP kinase